MYLLFNCCLPKVTIQNCRRRYNHYWFNFYSLSSSCKAGNLETPSWGSEIEVHITARNHPHYCFAITIPWCSNTRRYVLFLLLVTKDFVSVPLCFQFYLGLRLQRGWKLQGDLFLERFLHHFSLSDFKTIVSTSIWTIMHDENNFSNPNTFLPERWIESERGNETCNKAAWLPFSIGLRNCVGRRLVFFYVIDCLLVIVWR